MRPYYDNGRGIVLYHGDCREVLPTLARDSADLIVTDPPYGVGYQRHKPERLAVLDGDESPEDARRLLHAALQAAFHALRDKRHVYLFGRYDLDGLPLCGEAELIWDKGVQSGGDIASPWGSQHEYIQFRTYYPSAKQRADGSGRMSARLRRGSILRVQRDCSSRAREHPTAKPVPLLRMLIESSSLIGETVLDPFAGVGSTLVAAALEGRNAVGIEIEERYCEIAAKRLEQMPLPLEAVS